MNCKNCEINSGVKYSPYASGEFCCKKCARAYSTKNKRIEINKSVSETLTGTGNGNVTLICNECNKSFVVEWRRRKQLSCSKSCSTSYFMKHNNMASIMGLKSVAAQKHIRRSKNEILFAELCKNRFISTEFNAPIFNGWDADVIIHDHKLAILWNGNWHHKKITSQHSVEQVQKRDQKKMEEILELGYKYWVIEDFGKYNSKFVEEKFQEILVFLKLI